MYTYFTINKIGGGGFADIYRAIRSDTGAEVALKMLRDYNNHECRHQFRREVRQLLSLNHSRIIKILDYNLEDKRPWYAMPFMTGGALTRWAGSLPTANVRRILLEMATVLKYLHDQGAIHRDIKLDNLLVDFRGKFVVGDFGLGNNPKYTMIFTQHAAGTPGYMAPELMMPTGVATFAADMYSLGATIFHLLTGIHPADVSSLDPWIFRRDIPKDLRDIVLNLVHRNPNARPSAQQLLTMLAKYRPRTHEAFYKTTSGNTNSVFRAAFEGFALWGLITVMAEAISGR